jgi:hypothetical protein
LNLIGLMDLNFDFGIRVAAYAGHMLNSIGLINYRRLPQSHQQYYYDQYPVE